MKQTLSFIKLIKQKITDQPEVLFLSVALVFGFVFAVLVPPFQIPDEFVHFTRAYEVSELKSPQKYEIEGINHLGSLLPESILKTYKKVGLHQIPRYPDVPQAKKYVISDTKKALQIPLNKSEVTFIDTGSSPGYFPLLYAPQAISIALLQLFNAPVIFMLYATRIVGLLVWVGLVMVAFRFVRPASRKLPLAAILLLPMFISQASASTDPLINGLIVVFIAMVISFIVKKVPPSPMYMAILILILSITTLSKPVYAIFGLLLFLLPHALIGWKMVVKSILLLSVSFVVFIFWSAVTKVSGSFYFNAVAISKADPSSQIHYLLANLTNFFQPFTNTFLLNWGDGVYASLIGVFGKLDTPLPLLLVILGYLIIFVATVASSADQKTQKFEKKSIVHNSQSIIIGTLLVVGYILGVYLAMYIASTPPGEKIVTGVQGRYLLPLIPFGVLFASKGYFSFRKRTSYETFLIVLPTILLLASAAIVFLRYYVQYP